MTAIVFGATRGVGLHVAELLTQQGRRVVALVREHSDTVALERLGVERIIGDARDPRDVARAFSRVGSGALVVSTLGGRTADDARVDDVGNIAVIDGAAAIAPSAFVLVTSLGCGEMRPFMSERALAAFGDALLAKTRAEEHLEASALPWHIVRPGGLKSEPATGRGALYDHVDVHGFIHREDVAHLVLLAAADPSTRHRALVALDRDQLRGDAPSPVLSA